MTVLTRKVVALVVVALMALSMTAALADPTVTITAPAGHTYEIYQVFTGTVNGNKLSSLKYGKNAATGIEGDSVSIADMTELASLADGTYANDQATIAAYEKFVNFGTEPIKTVASATVSDQLAPGWYVIKDKMEDLPEDEGATLYMFQVLNADFSNSAKSSKPTSEKKVDDANDTTGSTDELQDSADYEIGDLIPYTLTFTLPSDYANYKRYYVNFKDKLSTGLTLNPESVQIQFGSGEFTSIEFSGSNPYNYEIADLKTDTRASALNAGDKITIKYTAYLNSGAVIGNDGNENTYTVEFSNNPNQSSGGTPTTSETPEDVNVVFTYKTIFDKVDENNQPLEGADFVLEKKVGENWVDVTTLGTSAHPSKIGTSAEKSTTFEFTGLDDGTYRLTESYTPAGYNTIEPIEFQIVANHVVSGDTKNDLTLTTLEATGGITVSGNVSNGTISTSVVNESGVVLPSTGGIGTTIFYVAGSVLVLAAAILLVTKRRMAANA